MSYFILWKSVSKISIILAFWYSCCQVICSESVLLVWPTVYGRDDSVWLPRPGHKSFFPFSLLSYLLWGKPAVACYETIKQSWGKAHLGKNWGLSIISEHQQPASHVSEPSETGSLPLSSLQVNAASEHLAVTSLKTLSQNSSTNSFWNPWSTKTTRDNKCLLLL